VTRMPRDARIDDGDHRLQDSRRSLRRLPAGSVCRPACPCPVRDASGSCDTSRQHNTHNIEARQVCYPWHPWFGRSVVVYEKLVKQGHAVCRCGLEEVQHHRSIEIPTWMFEPAACCRLRVMTVPTVGCDALLELKALLRAAQRPAQRPDSDGVLQAQHRSLLTAGGADATA